MRTVEVKKRVKDGLDLLMGETDFLQRYKLQLVEQGELSFTLLTTLANATEERIRFDCDNYPQHLPSVYLVDETNERRQTPWPPYQGVTTHDAMGGISFFCCNFNREYYSHSSHRNESPDKCLKGITLKRIVGIFMKRIHGC